MKRLILFLSLFVFACFQLLQAQMVQISGRVTTSEDGSTLPGVSVVVKGSTIGTLTDAEGNYKLAVPADATNLVFSYVGMKTVEVAIAGRTVVDLVMESDLVGLGDIVVTAIGIRKEAKALGYSVTEVEGDEVVKSSSADIVNKLSSRVAGVRITSSSGAAGASTFITIRGASSLEGNNQPLFIVDGIPILSGGGGYGVDGVATSKRTIDINPEDIENISVLKGGQATALYGVRAANGAIVITTKRGQSMANKVRVDLHSAITISQLSQTIELQDKFSQGSGGGWAEGSSLSWGARVDTLFYYRPPAWEDQVYQWNPDGWLRGANQADVDPAYLTNERAKTFDQYDFFQNGIAYDNNLSLSGGNDFTTYYFSIGHFTEEGIVPNNTFHRTSLRLNLDTKVSSKVSVGGSATYVNSGGDRIQQGSNTSGVMLGLVRTPPTFNNAAFWKFPDGQQRTYRNGAGYDNPYWTANENLYKDVVDRFFGNLNLNYNATQWFNVQWRVGTDLVSNKIKDYLAIGSRTYPTGRDYEFQGFDQSFNSDLLLNFRKDFFESFKFSFTLGHNMYQYNYRGVSGQANGLEIPNFYQISNTASQTTSSGVQKYRTAAIFGDLQLQFKEMLFLSVTGRNEWSTTMPEDNLSDFYPSVGVSFVFTELPMLQNNSVLSFGKLRASYAQIGNFAGPYNTLSYYFQQSVGDGWTTGLSFPLLGYAGYTIGGQVGNTKLKHERQSTYEVGLDLRFFLDRLAFDFTYFNKLNEDLLLGVPIATSSGYSSAYLNAGAMESKGIELMVNIIPVKVTDFQWDLNFNFTKYDNKVKQLAPNVDNLFLGGFVDPQIRAVAGEDYPSIYGYDFWRDDDGNLVINDDPDDAYLDGFPMGNYELTSLGKVNPDWTMGINNTFSFKGITLGALLDIRKGGLMWNGTLGAIRSFGTSKDTEAREADDLYVYDGVKGHLDTDAEGNTIVVATTEMNDVEVVRDEVWYNSAAGEGSGFNGPTISAVEETDWIRLREISLSYVLPKSLLDDIFIKNVEVYATGHNLFLRTPNYTGIDPETNMQGSSNSQGMEYFNMPGIKSYTFGLRLGF